jgi:hypothetical protein
MRIGWLVWLLTAGVALVPARVHAQGGNIGPEDPVAPLPIGRVRMEEGGPYLAGEFVFWRMTNPLHDEQIAVRGVLDYDSSITGTQGGFLGSRQAALRANDVGPGTYIPGFRVTGGWMFGENQVAVEVNWLRLFEARYAASATAAPPFGRSGPQLADTFLTSFVYNFTSYFAGPAQKVNFGNPGATYGIWDASSEQTIQFWQRYDQVEIRARIPLYLDECSRMYWILGPRGAWLWERFYWRTVAFDINSGNAGQDDAAIYTNIVSQRFYGAFCGAGYEYYKGETPIGSFAVTLEGDAAIYADIVKERAKYERADFATASQRVIKTYVVSPALQANINLWWYPLQAVQLRLGYNVLALFNTVAAQDPVSFNYGGLDPPWVKGITRFLDGFNAGIGFSF